VVGVRTEHREIRAPTAKALRTFEVASSSGVNLIKIVTEVLTNREKH